METPKKYGDPHPAADDERDLWDNPGQEGSPGDLADLSFITEAVLGADETWMKGGDLDEAGDTGGLSSRERDIWGVESIAMPSLTGGLVGWGTSGNAGEGVQALMGGLEAADEPFVNISPSSKVGGGFGALEGSSTTSILFGGLGNRSLGGFGGVSSGFGGIGGAFVGSRMHSPPTAPPAPAPVDTVMREELEKLHQEKIALEKRLMEMEQAQQREKEQMAIMQQQMQQAPAAPGRGEGKKGKDKGGASEGNTQQEHAESKVDKKGQGQRHQGRHAAQAKGVEGKGHQSAHVADADDEMMLSDYAKFLSLRKVWGKGALGEMDMASPKERERRESAGKREKEEKEKERQAMQERGVGERAKVVQEEAAGEKERERAKAAEMAEKEMSDKTEEAEVERRQQHQREIDAAAEKASMTAVREREAASEKARQQQRERDAAAEKARQQQQREKDQREKEAVAKKDSKKAAGGGGKSKGGGGGEGRHQPAGGGAKKGSKNEVRVEHQQADDDGVGELSGTRATGLLGRVWDTLCQVEQDLGSCIFTMVYFLVYFALHGPTVRLFVIGCIVLLQFSFQLQMPLFVWEPFNTMCEWIRDTWPERWTIWLSVSSKDRRRAKAEKKQRRVQLVLKFALFALFAASIGILTSSTLDRWWGGLGGVVEPHHAMRVSKHKVGKERPVSKFSQDAANALCNDAQKAEARRAWHQVQSKLQRALRLDPACVCALYNYGRLLDYLWQEGDLAEHMYLRAVTANPQHIHSLRNYAFFLYYVRRDYAMAEGMFERALEVQQDEIDVLSGYGSLLYYVRKDLVRAQDMFTRALQVVPNHINTLHTYGKLMNYGLEDIRGASELYDRVLQAQPLHVGVMLDYAGMLYARKAPSPAHVNLAAELWGRVLSVHPSHVDAMYSLAGLEHTRGNAQKAESIYKRVLAASPDHVNAISGYGRLLMSSRRPEMALEMFEKVLSTGCEHPISLVSAADVHLGERRDADKARELYKRAFKASPLKSITPAGMQGKSCWLCCNVTRGADLCCIPGEWGNGNGADEEFWRHGKSSAVLECI